METLLNYLKGMGIDILNLSRYQEALKPEELAKILLRRIIAYSNPYIIDAIDALRDNPAAVAIIMAPHDRDRIFRSIKEALLDQKNLTGKQEIPILFTDQGRNSAGGQELGYLGLLLDVLEAPADPKRFIRECEGKKWILQDGNSIYGGKNLLLIKAPIIAIDPPISAHCLLNALMSYKNYAKPTHAISLPSPKIINDDSVIKIIEVGLREIRNIPVF